MEISDAMLQRYAFIPEPPNVRPMFHEKSSAVPQFRIYKHNPFFRVSTSIIIIN